ncbi:MAG: hypothetical protein ACYSUV_00105 [Planctomycetota bacterium]|jgi:hypothetical protein
MNRMARPKERAKFFTIHAPYGAESQADNLVKTTVEKDLWVQG